MTRPKVLLENRQRISQACDICKRRKQKCNGLCPCTTCAERSFSCTYTSPDDAPSAEEGPASKVQKSQHSPRDSRTSSRTDIQLDESASQGSPVSSRGTKGTLPAFSSTARKAHWLNEDQVAKGKLNLLATSKDPTQPDLARELEPPVQVRVSGERNERSLDEEAFVYSQTRMLQDPTGRLLYVGDAASLSFLQLLRMLVEGVAGPSPFTQDPQRHKITESQLSTVTPSKNTHMLPDRKTAFILADAFFINTLGMVRVFAREAFFNNLEQCFSHPLSMDSERLCLINLVFAIGLLLATPEDGTDEAFLIDKLRNESVDRAEIFYLNGVYLNNPATSFEEADFGSVKSLLLMSLYMLAKSKRNTACAFLGMAVRSAYALGLHREETMEIYCPEDQMERRDVFRSLFVLDRFVSCSLGRPAAIWEEDCGGDIPRPPDFDPNNLDIPVSTYDEASGYALEASVRSCMAMGKVLRLVYLKRTINLRIAQELADVCKVWPTKLLSFLHWGKAATASAAQGVAILHVNLLYCHSIILLTRPFFILILNTQIQDICNPPKQGSRRKRVDERKERFGEACVIASSHTIVLVQNAFEARHLPRRDPYAVHFLFSAALVLLANEFAGLYLNGFGDQHIAKSITILSYCAKTEPHASRLLHVVNTFWQTVLQYRARRLKEHQSIGRSLSPTQSQNPRPRFEGDISAINSPNMSTKQSSRGSASGPRVDMDSGHARPSPVKFSTTVLSDTDANFQPSVRSDIEPQQSREMPARESSFSLSTFLDLDTLYYDLGDSSALDGARSNVEDIIDFSTLWTLPITAPGASNLKAAAGARGGERKCTAAEGDRLADTSAADSEEPL